MYNAEKYIGECLDSILAQTFKKFEVIIVDDCSTDSSPTIVQSYLEKFGGRLKIFCTESNTGGPAMPRNKGLRLSRGDYIFLIDNDDLIKEFALEKMYTYAKNYNADVVYCENNYLASDDLQKFDMERDAINSTVPTFESEDLAERVRDIGRFFVPPWRKFVKRDLIIDHNIFFPYVTIAEDDIWTYGLIFYAKKFLRIPDAVYIRRLSNHSVTRTRRTWQQILTFNINPVILGLKTINNFMDKVNFFANNPEYRYAIFEFFIQKMFGIFSLATFQLPSFVFYETIKQEFGKKLGEQDVLVSALCAFIGAQQTVLTINQQKFNQFAAQAQARITELETQLKNT